MEGVDYYLATYGEYLEELRKRLLKVAVLFSVAFCIGFFTTTSVVRWLVAFFKMPDAVLVATSPFQLLDLAMSIGYVAAAFVTAPYVLYHGYAFLRSGLHERERRTFLWALPIIVGLFICGFAYGFAIMYYALGVVATVNATLGITNLWDVSQFIALMVTTAAFLGLLFEFPVVLTVLIRKGLVDVTFLAEKRRHAYVVILMLVILLPPTDGLSAIVMAAPLGLIYELTVFVNSFGQRNALSD